MNINELVTIIKKKIESQIRLENISIEDKTFLHKNHSGFQAGKFHIKISITSTELKKLNRIDSNKKIYKILDQELKTNIHSLQILIK
ncbi:BolA/IbaG family iron-sulfur metabolism protein [Pelagibacterales bacterium SAG-MED19]|nr:BolA/IbaG family iron-sulfur metabolism protein [Pelagibacterales bacterium SAG-MED19]